MGLSAAQVLRRRWVFPTLLCEKEMLWEGMKAKMKASSQSIPIKRKHTFLLNATLSLTALFLGPVNDDWDPLYWSSWAYSSYIQITYLLFSSLQLFPHTEFLRQNQYVQGHFFRIFPAWLGVAQSMCYFPWPVFSTGSDLHLLMAQLVHCCHCVSAVVSFMIYRLWPHICSVIYI